jgi:broad specificity phosphatase PhoE
MFPVTAPTPIFLVRHAESTANADGEIADDDDAPLTDRGVAQSRALIAMFESERIASIHSSDLARARASVAPLADARQLPVSWTARLREPVAGRRPTRFADVDRARGLLRDVSSSIATPRTESHAELVARLRAFVGELTFDCSGSGIVVCSHFATLNVLVRLLVDRADPPPGIWIDLANASVSRVDFDVEAGVGEIRFLNQTSGRR